MQPVEYGVDNSQLITMDRMDHSLPTVLRAQVSLKE